jgi:large subunit ribosomal protein L21
MYAVIASGGKQTRVSEGEVVELELLKSDAEGVVSLTPVLVVDGDTVLSTPSQLATATVSGKVLGTVKGPKINGFTYSPKARTRRAFGHRQQYARVEITSITR